MSILNSVWGLIFLAILAVIVFINANKIGGESGGKQTAQIMTAAGASGSELVSTLEGNPYQGG